MICLFCMHCFNQLYGSLCSKFPSSFCHVGYTGIFLLLLLSEGGAEGGIPKVLRITPGGAGTHAVSGLSNLGTQIYTAYPLQFV